MAYYYCIRDVLEQMESVEADDNPMHKLVPVSFTRPSCSGSNEDAFVLASSPKILDLREQDSIAPLADLVNDVPLYGINLELLMDEALTERHSNQKVLTALEKAFIGQSLPKTMPNGESGKSEEFSESLRHPMIAHIPKKELCKLYVDFLNALDKNIDQFRFEKQILGKHAGRFTEHFDGFIAKEGGKIKAHILIAFGMRCDHDPARPMESYVEEGHKEARKMRIEEPREILWAWLEADEYQNRRCRDIDRIFYLENLPKIPNWVRTDIFCCLEKEAMKQQFAADLANADPGLSIIKSNTNLLNAIKNNAQDQVDDKLQQLMSQALTPEATYAGAAAKFAEQSSKRLSEARAEGFI